MISDARSLIKSAEGLRLFSYDDQTGSVVGVDDPCLGKLTIGWGSTSNVHPGQTITQEQADELFEKDYARAKSDAVTALGTQAWEALDPIRQAVLIDMAFNLGLRGLVGFHNTLKAVRNGDWLEAHDGILHSKADQQEPRRWARNAAMMLTGQWPRSQT